MNKQKVSQIIVLVFFVQAIAVTHASYSQDIALNPPTKITAPYFKDVYAVVSLAIALYKLDAIDGNSKASIIARHGAALLNPEVRFDLEHMDMKKKGWTRYYPVTINGRDCIVRVFLTGEKAYQSEVPVLFEMEIANPAVTCQVIPNINAILDDCSIAPRRLLSDHGVATSL